MFGEVFVVFDYIKEMIFLQRYSAICAQKPSKFKSLQKTTKNIKHFLMFISYNLHDNENFKGLWSPPITT